MKKSFVLMFDIPNEERALARRVQRLLNKKADMLQKSVWKSDNLNELSTIASVIKKEGGQATILRYSPIV